MLLGSVLPPNVELFGVNSDLVGLQYGYWTPNEKNKKEYLKFIGKYQHKFFITKITNQLSMYESKNEEKIY